MYNIDFSGFIWGVVILSVTVTSALWLAVPWLWSIIKPLLHAATA